MKKINQVVTDYEKYPTKVIQFGEGNFLRAFVDWQIHQMNQKGLFKGGIKIVQPLERGMGEMLKAQDNLYTVLLEGILDGQKVQSNEVITEINDVLNPYEDYAAYLKLAEEDSIEFIFSNTTEAGIAFDEQDQMNDQTPKSYPAKLTALLYRRFELKKPGFQIIPCELINHNGAQLKDCILQYATLWQLGAEFIDWINNENDFYATLVDRIVPGYPKDRATELCQQFGYEDQLIVKAEPFLIFVIEGNPKLAELLPLKAAGINAVFTTNMQPYRERKVRLLNGPHTTMAPIARLAGIETVGQVMNDGDFSKFVNDEMYQEIMPVIDLPDAELAAYAEAVKERFSNPFVKHELQSIALNSVSKFKARLLPTLVQFEAQEHRLPRRIVLALAALLVTYGDYPEIDVQPIDMPDVMADLKAIGQKADYVEQALQDTQLWGQDLTQIKGLVTAVEADVQCLLTQGARQSVQMINQEATEA
ncbi:tagaturonate reductase [Latilactobacillus fuchuensis]|uniref:Tagaturonate reductase (Altronate oxidoreductase) n=1 Tax=Latilactobacillus fuchuensis TaxID=164393 RepID=A0A2N9DUU4_9LACO|nr:tagaturonate reductase [Latilactobacillus fuchuensis]SPC37984.1 tagaturonate reductase (altronate oxidoreductase) [Latilactobacillus fuchuensis]